MDARRISPGLSVSPQLTVEDVKTASDQGFRAIICNRPDGEAGDQPGFAEIASAAASAGVETRHIPVVPGQIGEADITAFDEALKDLPGPVLAYCRTGTRSAMLWALAMADEKPLTDILATTQAAGYDVSALITRLAARVASGAPS